VSHSVLPQLKPKDFASDQEVRWCPGCGDYAILKAIQKTLAELEVPREQSVFISGIGCSSRFPYYMATYGFHTIHGRAPAIATGTKLANPDLDVWVITGDGDGLSIGGNHLVHALRRNVDLNVILFNNEIYGLTKGQVSPTSKRGTLSPTTPRGSVANPISPATMALGVGARFVARSIDISQTHLVDMLKQAHAHAGTSFVEIFQNCIVFNDKTFADFTDKETALDAQLHVAHGEPLRFGRDDENGLRLNPANWTLEVVRIGEDGVTEADVVVHDSTNRTLATMLAALEPPAFPMAVGVLYHDPAPTFDRQVLAQVQPESEGRGLADLLYGGRTWTVSPDD
jgi:2-oxoglutarate ferredoxin oxidoreductase subunit beta